MELAVPTRKAMGNGLTPKMESERPMPKAKTKLGVEGIVGGDVGGEGSVCDDGKRSNSSEEIGPLVVVICYYRIRLTFYSFGGDQAMGRVEERSLGQLGRAYAKLCSSSRLLHLSAFIPLPCHSVLYLT